MLKFLKNMLTNFSLLFALDIGMERVEYRLDLASHGLMGLVDDDDSNR